MAGALKIQQETLPQAAVLVLSGTLDAHSYAGLEIALEKLFAAGQHRILLDLADLQYMSSAGAGVLIGSLSEAQDHGGNIALLKPQAHVREVLDLLGLSQIFPIHDERAAALKALG